MMLKTEEKRQKIWEIYKELFILTMGSLAANGDQRQINQWKDVPNKEEICKHIYDCASTAVNCFSDLIK